jgi:hypothetical protein
MLFIYGEGLLTSPDNKLENRHFAAASDCLFGVCVCVYIQGVWKLTLKISEVVSFTKNKKKKFCDKMPLDAPFSTKTSLRNVATSRF